MKMNSNGGIRSVGAIILFQVLPLAFGNIRRGGSVVRTNDGINSRMLQSQSDFAPLECNTKSPDDWDCTAWPFTENVITSDVVVPCNTCYHMDAYTNDETVEVQGFINIIGKLKFSNETKLTLITNGIVVQGELEMTSTKIVDGVPDITISFSGSSDINFTPNAQNAQACGGSSCNLGQKPFVVAGGKLNINGMPDACPTWSTINSLTHNSQATPSSANLLQSPILNIPDDGTICTKDAIKFDFESGLGSWTGNLGADERFEKNSHDLSRYLKITGRTTWFQGPMYELSSERQCILSNVDYFFQAKIRIGPGAGLLNLDANATSKCSEDRTQCPNLKFNHMNADNVVRWRTFARFEDMDWTDGKWHDLKKVIRFQDMHVNATDLFSMLIISGPEAGIDIDIDDFSISLPPAETYSDVNNACGNLIRNGDGSQLMGFVAPFYRFMKKNGAIALRDDFPDDLVNSNPYFTVTDRTEKYDNLVTELSTGCLEPGASYDFSFKYRIHSVAETKPIVLLKTHTDASPIINVISTTCDPSSNDIGWVTCSTEYIFETHHHTAPKVELVFYNRDDSTSVLDYDDISFIFKSGGLDSITLNDESDQIDKCWGAGAEVVFSSSTLLYDDTVQTTLESVNPGGVITPFDPVDPKPVSSSEDQNTPGEVALLSRNILFKSEEDNSSDKPYLEILNTPNVAQKIQGVKISHFGVEAVSGKHPISFKTSGDVSGSVIAKNSIISSEHRCINIHGTQNVMVRENVAYKTKGHCYALEGAGETGNVFERNFGAQTLKPNAEATGATDLKPATFYATHPTNSWRYNSAAGSQSYGFFFEFYKNYKDENDKEINPMLELLTEFSGNVMHSNWEIGLKTYPRGFIPRKIATISNTKSYKNRYAGFQMAHTGNLIIDGGYFGDNRINIDMMRNNAITIKNIDISGYSNSYKALKISNKHDIPTHCTANYPMTGIRVDTKEMQDDEGLTVLENINFSNFDTECNLDAVAINVKPSCSTCNDWTAIVKISKLTHQDVPKKINLCSASEVTGISIVDIDGSLNPLSTGSGVVVGADFNDNSCQILSDGNSCSTKYCVRDVDNSTDLSEKSYGDGVCLINPDFESGQKSWVARNVDAPLQIVTGFGGSGTALKVSDRKFPTSGGLWQIFDASCFLENEWYEISADVKMTSKDSIDTSFVCDPALLFSAFPKSCAGVGLYYGVPQAKLRIVASTVGTYDADGWTKIYGIFEANAKIMEATGSNSLAFIIGRADKLADITVDNVLITRATNTTTGVRNCDRPIMNGDAEIGDHRFWWINGGHIENSDMKITLTQPGYDGSNYSFKHEGTRKNGRGMLQILDNSCFEVGSNWILSAKFRLYDRDGSFASCSKNTTCPVFNLQPGGDFKNEQYKFENIDLTEVKSDGNWYDIKHEFTIKDSTDLAFYNDENMNEMYLLLNSVPAELNYELDNIELVRN